MAFLGNFALTGFQSTKMPPPVPPKKGQRRIEQEQAREDTQGSREEEQEEPEQGEEWRERVDSDDPMRSAYEDSTIGRDHSVLPPGARPSSASRRYSAHARADGTSGSSDEERPAKRVVISPMVQPELVASGRYFLCSHCDPNFI